MEAHGLGDLVLAYLAQAVNDTLRKLRRIRFDRHLKDPRIFGVARGDHLGQILVFNIKPKLFDNIIDDSMALEKIIAVVDDLERK